MKKLSLKSLSVFISVLFLLLAVLTINKSSNVLTKTNEQKLDTVEVVVAVHEPKILYGMVVDDYLLIEDKIKRNQLLGDILTEYNVPATLINQLSSISKQIFDVRKIAPDKKYTLICNQDSLKSLKALVYEPNPIEYVVLKFGDSLSVDLCKREVVTVEKSISGIIRSKLSDTNDEIGISN
jgi:hypothetical protein